VPDKLVRTKVRLTAEDHRGAKRPALELGAPLSDLP